MKPSKGLVAGFWISTVLFALQMGFTAYAQLQLPQVAGLCWLYFHARLGGHRAPRCRRGR